MSLPLRVAIVGAGPAGIYAADILTTKDPAATVDIFDRLPTPYGLIRYGVAPDHPRIKAIIVALHRVLENERIRFIGNVHVGVDLKVDELRQFYDAVIFATGAERDRSLRIPGEELRGSYGAADFVAFYDSHPDREQTWDLSGQRSVAVVGVGNVGLDVARMLARTADELLATDIPPHVYNADRYAGADARVVVRCGRAGDVLEFSVADTGAGFAIGAKTTGAGLVNMRDRVESAGGSLRIESTSQGSCVTGRLPLG